jgi:hypothetical protein
MQGLQDLANAARELRPYIEQYLPTMVRWGVQPAISLVKALWQRYKNDPPATQREAVGNFVDASRRISATIGDVIASGRMTEQEVQRRIEQPDFLKSLQRVLLNASETSDKVAHEELARLVAARLEAAPDSRKSILLRIAAEDVKDLTGQQLRLLGLMYAVLHIGTDDNYQTWEMKQIFEWVETISATLRPFDDIIPDELDLDHLGQVGAIHVRPFSNALMLGEETGYSALFAPLNFAWQSLPIETMHNPYVTRISTLMESDEGVARGFDRVSLTPVGQLLGKCAYAIAQGLPFVPDE